MSISSSFGYSRSLEGKPKLFGGKIEIHLALIPITLSNYSSFILASWWGGYLPPLSGPSCSIGQQLVPYLFDYQIRLHPVPHPLLLKM